jgi:soluble lytic murein transglycosylase-like protein
MAAGPVLADTPLSVPLAGNALCRKAIAAAERAHGIPPHLLAAIARVESGRRDPIAGTFDPWPWTINMDGQGTFYDNKTRAMAAAVAIQPRAERSIDVGCMQISLTYHPDAFTDMAQAFDPASNAEYGARFLMQLFEKTNAWPKAVALYHSGTADLGDAYQRRVYAAWPEEQKLADGTTLYPMTTGGAFGVKRSLLAAPLRQGPPHVIPLVPGLDGGAPAGRSLQAYRLAPVRMASRAP